MNHKGVCRTAPATPGLLIGLLLQKQIPDYDHANIMLSKNNPLQQLRIIPPAPLH